MNNFHTSLFRKFNGIYSENDGIADNKHNSGINTIFSIKTKANNNTERIAMSGTLTTSKTSPNNEVRKEVKAEEEDSTRSGRKGLIPDFSSSHLQNAS